MTSLTITGVPSVISPTVHSPQQNKEHEGLVRPLHRRLGVQGRAATVVGIPKISRYTDFFQNSVFLEAKGGALLYVQKSVKLGIFATFFLKSR